MKERKRIEQEQALTNLVADQEFSEAALMAFRIGKFRDLHYVLKEFLKPISEQDPLMAVLKDFRDFRQKGVASY